MSDKIYFIYTDKLSVEEASALKRKLEYYCEVYVQAIHPQGFKIVFDASDEDFVLNIIPGNCHYHEL